MFEQYLNVKKVSSTIGGSHTQYRLVKVAGNTKKEVRTLARKTELEPGEIIEYVTPITERGKP